MTEEWYKSISFEKGKREDAEKFNKPFTKTRAYTKCPNIFWAQLAPPKEWIMWQSNHGNSKTGLSWTIYVCISIRVPKIVWLKDVNIALTRRKTIVEIISTHKCKKNI